KLISPTLSNSYIPPRIQAPALCLDFFNTRDFAKSGHVHVMTFGEALLGHLCAACASLHRLAAIQPRDVGEKLDLLCCEITVCAVDLMEDMAGVDEKDFVFPVGRLLAAIQEPQRAG